MTKLGKILYIIGIVHVLAYEYNYLLLFVFSVYTLFCNEIL
jgi:hypothetical protein